MRSALLTLLILTAWAGCSGQTRSLSLLNDSTVIMGLEDFRFGVTLRYAQDLRVRDKVITVVSMRNAYRDLDKSNATLRATIAKNETTIIELRDQRDKQRERAEKAERKARRQNPVTFLLIGAVGGFIINNSLP